MPTIKKSSTIAPSSSTTTEAPPVAVPAPPAAPAQQAVPPPTPAASPPAASTTSTPAATTPDPQAALEQFVEQTVSQFDDIEVGLGNDPALTPAQKRHALKFRKGGEAIVGQIGNLAQQQQLESPALNVTGMMGMLGKAQALQPLSDRVHAFAKHVDDVIFLAQSTSLSQAQQFYALLQRRALTDNELDTALAPVTTFFARKPKAKTAGALTKPQAKATAKALKTLQKNAPGMLQSGAAAQGQAGASGGAAGAPTTTAAGAPPTGAGAGTGAGSAAPATGGSGVAATGNGAAGPAVPTGNGH
ncbi:MAG TPA: hypothetical protein VGG39_03135 [Polyangiaceae bacterium]|jgi:hypothetical protein